MLGHCQPVSELSGPLPATQVSIANALVSHSDCEEWFWHWDSTVLRPFCQPVSELSGPLLATLVSITNALVVTVTGLGIVRNGSGMRIPPCLSHCQPVSELSGSLPATQVCITNALVVTVAGPRGCEEWFWHEDSTLLKSLPASQ